MANRRRPSRASKPTTIASGGDAIGAAGTPPPGELRGSGRSRRGRLPSGPTRPRPSRRVPRAVPARPSPPGGGPRRPRGPTAWRREASHGPREMATKVPGLLVRASRSVKEQEPPAVARPVAAGRGSRESRRPARRDPPGGPTAPGATTRSALAGSPRGRALARPRCRTSRGSDLAGWTGGERDPRLDQPRPPARMVPPHRGDFRHEHYSPAGTNLRDAEFRQYLRPVGAGPSGKTCPRWPSQRRQRISVRIMP